MGIRVAVAGASGYAGGELLRLLAGHPDLEIAAVSAGSSAGKPITSIHPNLTGHPRYDGKNFDATDADTLQDAELIFMALPHGESAKLANELPNAKIIDLSADFRLGDEEAWHQFYGAGRRLRRPLGLRPARAPRREGARSRPPAPSPPPAATPPRPSSRSRPLLHAGPGRAGRHRDRRRLRHHRGRPLAPGRPPRQRGHGLDVRLQGRRRPPAHPGDRAGADRSSQPSKPFVRTDRAPPRPVTLSFTPTLAPMPRGILATATARLAPGVADSAGRDPPAARRVRRRLRRAARSSTCCPRASGR